jgi:C_GCAxxG_C_C family probable redox protein
MSKRQERAVMLYKSGYNCAQAVAIAYSDVLGMSEDKAGAIFSGFGGGFGGQHEVCGAVSAMTAVLGALLDVKDGDAEGKKKIYSRVQNACKDFKKEHESIICRTLLVNAKKVDESPKPWAHYIASCCAILDASIGKNSPFTEKE